MIIAVFVAVLVGVWGIIRLNRDTLATRLKATRRIEVESVARLTQDAQAALVAVDGARLLIVSGKRTGIAIHPLPADGAGPAVDTP
ncbi:MAG: hypothetical protein AAGF60_15255 [Pseudomonadota bacterium]